jgi:hypothetical protein
MSGGSTKDIQQLAEHKIIQISARYAHLSDAHIAERPVTHGSK